MLNQPAWSFWSPKKDSKDGESPSKSFDRKFPGLPEKFSGAALGDEHPLRFHHGRSLVDHHLAGFQQNGWPLTINFVQAEFSKINWFT